MKQPLCAVRPVTQTRTHPHTDTVEIASHKKQQRGRRQSTVLWYAAKGQPRRILVEKKIDTQKNTYNTHIHTLREGNREPTTKKPSVDDKRHSRAGQQALVSKHLIRPCKTVKLS